MQNPTTVTFKRNATPLIGVLAAMMGLMALTINSVGWIVPQKKSEVTERALSQPIYQEIARASHLLEDGQVGRAGDILDSVRTEPLLIASGGYGEGAMVEYSPTTLLMQLSYGIRKEVAKEAHCRQTEEALSWIARLHGLAHQALASTHPSYDSLWMVYYLKVAALQTEESLWKESSNVKRADQAREHRQHFEQFWLTRIKPDLVRCPHQNDSLVCGLSPNSGSEKGEMGEEGDAHALVRLITANQPL